MADTEAIERKAWDVNNVLIKKEVEDMKDVQPVGGRVWDKKPVDKTDQIGSTLPVIVEECSIRCMSQSH